MCRTKTVIGSSLLLLGISCAFWLYWSPRAYVRGRFPLRDAAAIRWTIRTQTFQKILRIYQETDGTVSIETGVVRGPLNGQGRLYRLKKTSKGWERIESGRWHS